MTDPHANGHPGAHEKTDADIPSVVRFGIGIAVLCSVAAVAMLLLFKFLESRPQPRVSELAESREIPPAPRLQVTPSTDLHSLQAKERTALESYGWIDQQDGTVRIPIDRAITLLAERGLPVRQEAKPEVKR
jgi:hypothetical protein